MFQENYLIINNKESANNTCYVFCSSNGLFWNSRDEKYVVENNYFEFQNIAKDKRISGCKKIIFLRDMDISFYVNGINKNIDSVAKIISFIEAETKGLDLIIVGISAGGYLANLLGLYLSNAKTVFGIGTIFNIRDWNGRHSYTDSEYLIKNESNVSKSKFYNLYSIFGERLKESKTTFYYLYGSKNKYDAEIAAKTRTIIDDDKFIYLPIKSKDHGVRLPYNTLILLLTTDKKLKTKKRPSTKFYFSVTLVGYWKAFYYLLLNIKYKVFKKHV